MKIPIFQAERKKAAANSDNVLTGFLTVKEPHNAFYCPRCASTNISTDYNTPRKCNFCDLSVVSDAWLAEGFWQKHNDNFPLRPIGEKRYFLENVYEEVGNGSWSVEVDPNTIKVCFGDVDGDGKAIFVPVDV